MMNMMNTTGLGAGFVTLWGVHVLSTTFFFTGVVLLIVWAVKSFDLAQLKTWGISLVVVGIISCLLTIGVRGSPWGLDDPQIRTKNMQMMHNMMNGMMDDDDRKDMNHMDTDDAMGMSMDDMSEMLEGKTGDAFDAAFIEGMIPHHQGAIEMARSALQSAKHEEIKAMARDIITAQQREIDQMKQWQQSWGYSQ